MPVFIGLTLFSENFIVIDARHIVTMTSLSNGGTCIKLDIASDKTRINVLEEIEDILVAIKETGLIYIEG